MLDPAREVKRLVEGKVDMAAFAQKVLEKFDGVDGIITMLRDEYDALDPGTKLRHEILKTILTLLERNSSESVEDDDLDLAALEAEKALLDRHIAESESGPGPCGAGCPAGEAAPPEWERDEISEADPLGGREPPY